jgi:hypothetical protein
MAGQETLRRHNGTAVDKPATTIRRNMTDLAHDVVTLLELQANLFKLDVKDTIRRSIVAVVVLLGGLFVLIACLTVALASAGYLLVEQAGLSYAASFCLSAVGGAILSGLMFVSGWLGLRRAFGTASRSRQEFERNLAWFKRVLKQRVPTHPKEEWK